MHKLTRVCKRPGVHNPTRPPPPNVSPRAQVSEEQLGEGCPDAAPPPSPVPGVPCPLRPASCVPNVPCPPDPPPHVPCPPSLVPAVSPFVVPGPPVSCVPCPMSCVPCPLSCPVFSILVGAPKANTSQADVTQGGAVYYCPWHPQPGACSPIEFDHLGTRSHDLGGNGSDAVEFKSLQWFGATVRAHNDSILACAPLYSWRTVKEEPGRDPVGSCFLSVGNFSKFVEYAPCRSGTRGHPGGTGGHGGQGGHTGRVLLGGPGSYFWQGQVISATQEQIEAAEHPEYLIQEVPGQLQTRQAAASYDDSYMGAHGCCVGARGIAWVHGALHGGIAWVTLTPPPSKMASYFGYAVAATDVNNDGLDDVLVGAPLLMERADGRLQERGRLYVFLQPPPGAPRPPPPAQALRGAQEFGRFGSAIAPLGDLDQDGYNDVAVGAPLGAEGLRGLVFVYNGAPGGLRPEPSQVLRGHWAPGRAPDFFGAALRGARDLDGNGYPGEHPGRRCRRRGRPIVSASASLSLVPAMFNPEERSCALDDTGVLVPCINLSFCLNASGRHLPSSIGFAVELSLDGLKGKGAVKRALFVSGRRPALALALDVPNGAGARCRDLRVYLRNETEFRDKLSPIVVALSFGLDPLAPADRHGLRPVLDYRARTRIEQKVVPPAGVPRVRGGHAGALGALVVGPWVPWYRLVPLGHSGATWCRLVLVVSPRATWSSWCHLNFSQLSCELERANGSSALVCDLGNPMKAGASIWGGLRFTLPHVSDSSKSVRFELQIRRCRGHPRVLGRGRAWSGGTQGVSRPEVVTLPGAGGARQEQDVGPEVEHVYEVVNEGPSTISQGTLELRCPLSHRGRPLLLVTGHSGPPNCTASPPVGTLPPWVGTALGTAAGGWRSVTSCAEGGCFRLRCPLGTLARQQRATLRLRFRVWAASFPHVSTPLCGVHGVRGIHGSSVVSPVAQVSTGLQWAGAGGSPAVPVWIVVLAALLGLLLLALLSYGLYKLGFFKRSLPYGTAMETAQLKPQAASEA
uniref:Integrin subunit alpha 5 n=1 Tax=Nothoprocta perdicaria TaxID=30464 RepID=A0A8C6ZPY7_NOTPE